MAVEPGMLFAGGDVPDSDGAVVGSGGEQGPVRGEGDRPDRPAAAVEPGVLFARTAWLECLAPSP